MFEATTYQREVVSRGRGPPVYHMYIFIDSRVHSGTIDGASASSLLGSDAPWFANFRREERFFLPN